MAHKRSVKTLQWATHQQDWMGGEGRYCKRTQGHPSPFYEDLTLLTVSSDGWQTATSLRRPKSQLAATSTESPWFINYITWAVEISHHSWGIFFLNQLLKGQHSWFCQLGNSETGLNHLPFWGKPTFFFSFHLFLLSVSLFGLLTEATDSFSDSSVLCLAKLWYSESEGSI